MPSSPVAAASPKHWAALFGITVFCAAFLVFLVQPLVGRLLLPIYGGAPAVWTTCLVFFQCTLLAGYALAHLVTLWLPVRMQLVLQVSLAATSIVALPFTAPDLRSHMGGPQQQVLWWLCANVALSFASLCTFAPTLQRWWGLLTAQEPFKLYAVSNAGSLLALVIYPLVVEPWFTVAQQSIGWAVAYAFTVCSLAVCAWWVRHVHHTPPPVAAVGWRLKVLWLFLAAVPSVLLLAVTNHITIDVASAPLLWVVPLFLYLLSFVLVFGPLGHRGQSAWLVVWIVAVAALGMNLFLAGQTTALRQVLVASVVLFSTCILCHGELLRHRPNPTLVTSFYLWMAAGGALGGAFAGVVAPRIFVGFFELQAAVMGTWVVLWCSGRGRASRAFHRWLYLALGVSVPLMCASWWLGTANHFKDATVLFRERSFYGLIQVTRFPRFTVLTSGRIRHGMQWNDKDLASQPTMYFAPTTAVGIVLQNFMPQVPRRLGILGLGVGTLAAYTRPTDDLWFYELDPFVVNAAKSRFSFLAGAKGTTHVVQGDGRSAVAADHGAPFDVLVLDAFSSDAVPTHLLTSEAFSLYARKVAHHGLLMANVSNRHLEIERVVAGAAKALGWHFELYETSTDLSRGITKVRWAVMARSRNTLASLRIQGALPLPGSAILWTDHRSSLLPIVRVR